MIVKNESEVIERCLGSLKDIIDYWVIVDTGSTDGTQDIIRKFLQDIPGELHERPWVDFGHNRNEALQFAKKKGDYLLFVDADEVLQMDNSFVLPHLNKDFYLMTVKIANDSKFARIALVNNALNWKWEGVIHEAILCPQAVTSEWLLGITNLCSLGGGARSKDPDKFLKDAQVLEKALEKDPENSRYVHYLAQTYFYAGKYDLSLKYYQKRVTMPGFDEDTFWAFLRIGMCQSCLKMPPEIIADSYLKAYHFRPTRAEPLYELAKLYRESGNPRLGYLISKLALTIPYPKEDTTVAASIYEYALLVEFCNCAKMSNRPDGELIEMYENLIGNPHLPESWREQVKAHLKLTKKL